MPKRARSTCKFVETDAAVSGEDSGDEVEEGELVETEEDRRFIDDTDEAAEMEEKVVRSIKISKRERRLHKDDLRLIRENTGQATSPPARAERSRVHRPRVYKDDDDEDADSDDEGFVVSDECSSDEEAGKVAERIVKRFVKGQGSECLPLAMHDFRPRRMADAARSSFCAGLPAAPRACKAAKAIPAKVPSGVEFMLKDPFYAAIEDAPEPSIADELLELCKHTPKPPPPERLRATAGLFLPGGAKKAWDAAAKWPGRGRITSPATIKAAAASSLKAAAEGPVTNSICIDKSTGRAYYRHADGRMSPRTL